MTIVPAARLTRRELLSLGHNTPITVRDDHREVHDPVNRSLAIHGEGIHDEDIDDIHRAMTSEWTAS